MAFPSFLLDAGIFGWLAMLVASTGLALATTQVAQRHRRSYEGAIAICAGLSLMMGLSGTGLGLRAGAEALQHANPENAERLWRLGSAIAWSCTSVGAMGAAVDLMALGVVGLLRPVRE